MTRGVLLGEVPLSKGERGTLETVQAIRRLIHDGRGSPLVRTTAEDVLEQSGVPERDQVGEVAALLDFVRGHLRFTNDPWAVEQLTTAEGLLLDHPFADCDEYVILLGSLLESIGRRVRLKVVRRGTAGPWQHIFLQVRIRDRWVSVDATKQGAPLGWEVPHGSAFTVDVDGPMPANGEGIGWVAALASAIGALGGAALGAKNDKDAREEEEKREKKKAKEDAKFKQKILDLLASQSNPSPALQAVASSIVPKSGSPGTTLPTLKTTAAPATPPAVIVQAAPAPAPAQVSSGLTINLPRNWWAYAAGGVAMALLFRTMTR
ncbi:MAG: hypothetical protein ACF8XB_18750 [Planctomycetota bacterium JB042]